MFVLFQIFLPGSIGTGFHEAAQLNLSVLHVITKKESEKSNQTQNATVCYLVVPFKTKNIGLDYSCIAPAKDNATKLMRPWPVVNPKPKKRNDTRY